MWELKEVICVKFLALDNCSYYYLLVHRFQENEILFVLFTDVGLAQEWFTAYNGLSTNIYWNNGFKREHNNWVEMRDLSKCIKETGLREQMKRILIR